MVGREEPDAAPTATPVDVSVVRPLRTAVLRPGRSAEASVLPGDDHPLALHVAVVDDGEVVSVGSVFPDVAPFLPDRMDAWRVRGMATRDGLRGRGLGHLVLSALIDHATANGGQLIWCQARIGAPRFYARSGFVTDGQPFVYEDIEHIHMWRDL